MAKAPIKLGDVVVLKSGGPRMTVSEIIRGGVERRALCEWYDPTDRTFEAGDFPLVALEKATTTPD